MADQVTDSTFADEVLRSDKPVIVDFWAEWCGPCRMVGPVVDQIGEEYADKVKVLKLDVENNPATAMKYGITSIPAIYVFKDGEVDHQSVGAKPKAALVKEFSKYLEG
ncbi:thioredoxin [Rothia aerolata]|uniref:Thioredoxin n=1 Tax=Rothia aerolata TaxID=1812262 RepID=A0A917IXX2_9MICC|nr:thioredoxin [Rothia aerolata]GGH66628.1 thioredoxin-1 [Rothia aerolata]